MEKIKKFEPFKIIEINTIEGARKFLNELDTYTPADDGPGLNIVYQLLSKELKNQGFVTE